MKDSLKVPMKSFEFTKSMSKVENDLYQVQQINDKNLQDIFEDVNNKKKNVKLKMNNFTSRRQKSMMDTQINFLKMKSKSLADSQNSEVISLLKIAVHEETKDDRPFSTQQANQILKQNVNNIRVSKLPDNRSQQRKSL